ncbi:amino acid permease 2 [Cordyceps fumosorosea ARSEF 2679]|uniref:Amino acid permease 2 n=1 Tax=Cordyceps fumosorosea (strain ARSEF 2679) TaxID=1081104 RepID=A0A167NCV2_CORFA|nr:amino acid permease 2 [Cordyceps fumosorosea ARSEF 2679]OAA55407.1 amino acid permease 2 [Cordyceps fumosorosea ARSEF 2679]
MSAAATNHFGNKGEYVVELTTSRIYSDHEESQDGTNSVYRATPADKRDMRRMGRKQEFIRQYRLFSMISFVAIATCAWSLNPFAATPALVDGGIPSMIWSNVWYLIGYIPVILSIAEMSSMAPIAGAHYHWVSEFAPENCQRILSYLTGSVTSSKLPRIMFLTNMALQLDFHSGLAGWERDCKDVALDKDREHSVEVGYAGYRCAVRSDGCMQQIERQRGRILDLLICRQRFSVTVVMVRSAPARKPEPWSC